MLRLRRFARGMTSQHPTGLARGSPRLHYAWVIVAVASMICMITSPVRFAISMLIPYLQSPEGFGWSYLRSPSPLPSSGWLQRSSAHWWAGLVIGMGSAAPCSWGPTYSSWAWCSLAA